jgi:N4-gp56 family major capsid protein|nr:MAG TPA: major capsid protein [Caudoviricetes sp.]
MVNYASKYEKQIDEKFKLAAMTAPAINNNFDFTGVNTVNVYSMGTAPMNDYSMTGNARYGVTAELDNSTQALVLSKDRSFTFTIDRRNYLDTQMTMEAGKALTRQIEEVVAPELDVYRLAKIAEGAKNSATAAITKANAYAAFLDAQAALTDEKAPLAGRLLYCGPTFYKFMKQDDTFVKASDIAQEMLLKGQLGMIDGVPLIVVPTSYLPENTAFVLTNPIACCSPVKLADYKIHDNPPGINGWLVEGRVYYDAFVLNNKKGAIYTHKIA